MLPPVLEIYVVWHPRDDRRARPLAEALLDHYHGDTFSGLIGGAVEVCFRSAGWTDEDDAPRPIPLPSTASPPGPAADPADHPAAHVAVVCLLGPELFRAVGQTAPNLWRKYLQDIVARAEADPSHVILRGATLGSAQPTTEPLWSWFGPTQHLAATDALNPVEPQAEVLCRDLSQSLAQALDRCTTPLTVFLSHTKHADRDERTAHAAFVATVRAIIGTTHLGLFFDSNTLQPGDDWPRTLEATAGSSAMLALRTDRYAGRDWCQREVVTAKTHGMPVVVLDALEHGESRGSFLLDHMPRLRAHRDDAAWDWAPIRRALGQLVDECLKRALWRQQQAVAGPSAGVDWWAPHAPEPLTLVNWLTTRPSIGTPARDPVLILHPDPPLTRSERDSLNAVVALAVPPLTLEVMTPRTLAARSGGRAP